MVKHLPAMWETQIQSLGQEDPLEKGMQPTPVSLPGESHGWRSLAGYSPWGHEESDMPEQLAIYFHKCKTEQILFISVQKNLSWVGLAENNQFLWFSLLLIEESKPSEAWQ